MNDLVAVYSVRPKTDHYGSFNRLDCLFASVALLRKFAPPMPVVIFHKDYGDEEKLRFKDLGDVRFERVDWSGHESRFISLRPAHEKNEGVGSYGYQMMCWFFSGMMQRHPAVSGYSHYLRMDDDAYLIAPLTDNIIASGLQHDYTYAAIVVNYPPTALTLWEHSVKFFAREGIKPQLGYDAQVPYCNFHVASQKLWSHSLVRRYLESIEAVDGFMRQGWDDAAIQMAIIRHLCPVAGLKSQFLSIPYRHNQHCLNHSAHTPYCYDAQGSLSSGGPPKIDWLPGR